MRRWIVLAALSCVALEACATGNGPPDTTGNGGATTAPPDGADEGAEGCGTTVNGAESACEEPQNAEQNEAKSTCLEACSEAAEKGCDWVVSMCDVAESVSIGTAKIPCFVATLVACGAALGGSILCDHICPH